MDHCPFRGTKGIIECKRLETLFSDISGWYFLHKLKNFYLQQPRNFCNYFVFCTNKLKTSVFCFFSKFSKITSNFKQNLWKSPLLAAPKNIVTPKALRRFLSAVTGGITVGMTHNGINTGIFLGRGFGAIFAIWSISSHVGVQIGRELVRLITLISLNKFLTNITSPMSLK